MLMCFGGAILSNFICGLPLFLCFDDTRAVFTATAVWLVLLHRSFINVSFRYIVNYSPFDFAYRLCKFMPIRLLICSLKEIQRAKKISLGVNHGLHQFPDSVVMCILLGLLKGAGYCEMKLIQRLVRGVWLPAATEFLHPTFTTKISLLAAIAFYLRHWDIVPLTENLMFLAIAAIFVYLRVTMILLGLKDPFYPFENIGCTVLFGGTVDALKNAYDRSQAARAVAAAASASAAAAARNAAAAAGPPGSPMFHATSGSAPHGASATGTGGAASTINSQAGSWQTTDKKRD